MADIDEHYQYRLTNNNRKYSKNRCQSYNQYHALKYARKQKKLPNVVDELIEDSNYLLNRIKLINEAQNKKHRIFHPIRTINGQLFFSPKALNCSFHSPISMFISNQCTDTLNMIESFCSNKSNYNLQPRMRLNNNALEIRDFDKFK